MAQRQFKEKNMNLPLDLNCTIKNEYHLELIEENTGKIKQVVDCHNVVLDNVYTNFAGGTNMSMSGISLGTGSVTPSAADLTVSNIVWTGKASGTLTKNYPNATKTLTVTVPAPEAVGDLTRCGVNNSDIRYTNEATTHALFTDSEGNPVVIHKTALDVLKITITLYYTFSLAQNTEPNIFLCDNANNAVYRAFLGEDNLIYGSIINIRLLLYEADKYTNTSECPSLSVYPAYMSGGVWHSGDKTYAYSADNVWNNGLGMDIKAITLTNIGTFNITSEHFPPQAIGKYQLGVGDGTNKEFHIKTPSAIAGTQSVWLNNVLQTEGVDYTFYPYNMKDFYTNYHSADGSKATYNTKTTSSSSNYSGLSYPKKLEQYKISFISDVSPIVYDFTNPITVNCLFAPLNTVTYYVGVKLEYSTNGTDWATFTTITSDMNNPADLNYWHVQDPITARYWRFIGPDSTQRIQPVDSTLSPSCFFGYYSPSVTFTVPPSSGAIIEIDYSIKYPFKNNMHSVTVNAGFTVGR